MQKNNQDTSAVYTPAQAVNIESQNGSKRRRRFVLPAAITFLVVAAIAAWYLLFIADFSRAQAVEAGSNALFFKIDEEGTLWGWGQNDGLLGDGSTTYRERPVKILHHIQQVSASKTHVLAVDENGTLWAWGKNDFGQLGNGTKTSSQKPVIIMENVKQAAAGESYSLAVGIDGTLYAWGRDVVDWPSSNGEDNWDKHSTHPVRMMDNVRQASAGLQFIMVVRNDGSLWGWGHNESGQLGNGTTDESPRPIRILDNVRQVSAGAAHAMAIRNDGSLWAWGDNESCQLGDGTSKNRELPVKILDNVSQVSAGNNYSMAGLNTGQLFGWGNNQNGQCSLTKSYLIAKPEKVADGVKSVSCCDLSSIYLTKEGKVCILPSY